MFGGNSNWRGPIWFYNLLIESPVSILTDDFRQHGTNAEKSIVPLTDFSEG